MRSVDFISYGGETLALCAAIPDWSQPLKLDIELPTQITDSLLKGESRRRFATSQRYSIEHLYKSDNTADSHDVRAWLNRLKVETVAVPLWMDEVELAADCVVHETELQIMGEQPVRAGAEWILMHEDGTDYEIILVTELTETTMTIAAPGTDAAWPAGTVLYPLMFGRLTERPQTESQSDEMLSGTFSFKENSPYARKLTPRVSPASLVGSHVPDFALYKLWTVEPDWSRPMDWTEADILYHQIGFGREEQSYQYQNWNRRGLEMGFTCTTRDEISEIEYFFNERKANMSSFFIPTFRGDLRLAADVADGATTFEIETSRYEIAAYDEQPWNAFLAFIDDSGIYPQRITEVNLTTITPEVPVGKPFIAAETNVCFLSLVRLVEPKLTWEYLADGTARTKLKFIELPGEYTSPGPALRPIAYLYKFTEQIPVPNEWFFTSHEDAIDFNGDTYTPAPFSHGRYRAARDLSDPFELTSWGGDFTGNPLNQFLPYVLNATMTVTVYRVNRDNPNDSNQRQLYYGDVIDLDATGPDWRANLRPFGRRLDQKFPRKLLQVPDNYIQFSPPTQLNAVTFKKTGTISVISGFNITVTGALSAGEGYFSGGWITTGTGANFERRTILAHRRIDSTTASIVLDRPLVHAIVAQAIDLYPGYDQSREQCNSKFNNNINFGGYPYVPDTNPSIEASEIVTPTGGKK